MKITPSNARKVAAIAAVVYWAIIVIGISSDIRSGEWLQKGGIWPLLWLGSATCGMAFWVALTPSVIRGFKVEKRPIGLHKWLLLIWSLSPNPVVVASFSLWLVAIVQRLTGD
ncbi:hypothetical protein HNR46_004205 [Haloferula luteola]|uniref:Uncharacterized protein n=1 Tax=Haloferula luteola TaxID=595692 RepID=A0A840V7D9_9BACT|nr:hypothetical protein [Haloferula luteola]MBB5353935.1 hypothetical protein [Haloferula luteola]